MTASSRYLQQGTAWLAALVIAAAALVFTNYQTRDPDSALHIAIEMRQAERPASEWIAPEWGGLWNSFGLYREHPVGTFVPPIVLIRLGFPPAQAGYVVNALYQALTVALIYLLAARYVPRRDARALAWLLQLIPIAFTYRIRANHEQGVLFFTLLAIYATDRARQAPWWIVGSAAAMAGMILVKGIFAVLVPPVCAAWLLATASVDGREWWREAVSRRGHTRTWITRLRTAMEDEMWGWVAIAAGVLTAAAVGLGYEALYRQVTGESFVAEYLRRQMGAASVQRGVGIGLLVQKLANAGWYLGRVAWFAFPWSIVLVVAAVRRVMRRRAAVAARPTGHAPHPGVIAALVGASLVWMAAFSLFDRRADRFIFPVYFLLAGAGAGLGLWVSPRFQRWVERVERFHPFEVVGIWLVTFFLHLATAKAGVPLIKP